MNAISPSATRSPDAHEPRAAATPTLRGGGSGPTNAWGLPPLHEVVCVDDLEVALREADRPLTARQIRTALDIHRAYLSVEVSRFLHVAVDSGRVVRQGNAVGTRYQAA